MTYHRTNAVPSSHYTGKSGTLVPLKMRAPATSRHLPVSWLTRVIQPSFVALPAPLSEGVTAVGHGMRQVDRTLLLVDRFFQCLLQFVQGASIQACTAVDDQCKMIILRCFSPVSTSSQIATI